MRVVVSCFSTDFSVFVCGACSKMSSSMFYMRDLCLSIIFGVLNVLQHFLLLFNFTVHMRRETHGRAHFHVVVFVVLIHSPLLTREGGSTYFYTCLSLFIYLHYFVIVMKNFLPHTLFEMIENREENSMKERKMRHVHFPFF